MKRHFLTLSVLALCGLLVFAGCRKKVATTDSPVKRTFKASIGGDGGKTSLNPSTGAVYWTTGDQIKVNGTSLTLGEGEGTTMGSFSGSVSGDYYVGAYPAASATVNSYTEGSERVTFTLPATQTLTENGFATDVNPMVAKSSTTDIAFRNVCGGLCIRIWATSGSADKVVVTSKSGAKLNGTYTVDYSGDTPTTSLSSDGTDVITMTGDAVTLSTDEDDPTKFFVMLPVGTYTGGFNVQVYSGETKILDKDFATATSIERNNIKLYAITQAAATPSVTTTAVSNISTTTAQSGGSGIDAAGGTISAKGVCWSTSTGPTINDSKTIDGEGTDSFVSSITGLATGSTYYVRAYVTNSYGTTSYGDQVSFTTLRLPTVATRDATSVASTSATFNGNLSHAGNPTITEKGFVYSSSNTEPVVNGTGCTAQAVSGTTTGAYSYNATGLSEGVTYYVRAYATNSVGTSYGDVISTTPTAPAVTTASVTLYNNTAAIMGGEVTDTGGCTTTRGIVYSATNTEPTLGGDGCNTMAVSSGASTGTYESTVTGLTEGTTYYVRAYTTNSVGTSYGSMVNFTTTNESPSTVTTNASGVFSVSADKQVYFASGNLVQTGASTYAFDAAQYTVHTGATDGMLAGYPRYYFRWWADIASASDTPIEFSIGGYTYTTLTLAEWEYLLNVGTSTGSTSPVGTRSGTASGYHYCKASVHTRDGMVLLPDGLSTSNEALLPNHDSYNASFGPITDENWTTLEAAGCVFLPVAGHVWKGIIFSTSFGNYWSITQSGGSLAYRIHFYSNGFRIYAADKNHGTPIRLVRVK